MSSTKAALFLACTVQLFSLFGRAESGPTFIPERKFDGSTLAGWHTLGSASWTANSGEITGKGGEGWLVLAYYGRNR